MKKTKLISTLAIFFVVIALCLTTTVVASAATTQSFETRTRSALLVDRSGSIKDQEEVESVMSTIDTAEFDFVGYFDDQQISLDPEYSGGGDSYICEVIDEVAKLGYTHITVITDGEQWPKNYSSLGLYTDLDLTIKLIGDKSEAGNELISELEARMFNSSLTVVKPDGSKEAVLEDYTPEKFEVEIPEEQDNSNNDSSSTIIDEHGKCYWWVALIIAVLVAALFDFIHELITRRRNQTDAGNGTGTGTGTGTAAPVEPKPIPTRAINAIAGGAGVVADFSGSMAAQQAETCLACEKAKTKKPIICFGNGVTEVAVKDMAKVRASGQTPGWEAMEMAAGKGLDEIVVVSDLGFNGKNFEISSFGKKFKKITVVVPERYNSSVLAELQQIAEEVEVLPL